MKILRRLLWLFFLFTVITCAVALAYYHAVTHHVRLSPDKLTLSERSVLVYDHQNAPVKNVSEFWKQTVHASDIPEHTKSAFIDTEDKRFLKHNGFDYKRLARAILNNAKARSFKEGASTISQQLIKNTHLSQEKTLKRKLQEWKLTKQLERRYNKDEILEKYLNSIYFGHNCFGLTAAAEFYFDKQVSELSIGDSAILAGLLKSPNNYSPFKHPENCQKRKMIVLKAMQKNGSINEDEYQSAIHEPLPTPKTSPRNEGYLHFVFEEFTEIADNLDFQVGGNLEIETYLDQDLQNEIETLANNIDCDKTVLVACNKQHGFKCAYSSVGNIPRLPGSLIKPLLVYAPALEENLLSPATPILDEKVNYGNYTPENFDKTHHGYVSARECVAKSYNIPAVKTLSSLGIEKGINYLQKMELNVDKDDQSLALALGGMKRGFSLCDITSAYTTLANNGSYDKCGFISKIKINGNVVYEKKENPRRVFSEESAYLMTDMLKTAVKSGTAKKMRSLPFDIAAKTGTVGTKNGNTDAYAVSYTPLDCCSVWLGNADNSPIPHTGGGEPCNILKTLNSLLYENYAQHAIDIPSFKQPKEVVCVALDRDTYYDKHTLSLADDLSPSTHQFSEWFKKDAIPLSKSDSFTNPRIQTPTLEVFDDRVLLHLDSTSPRYYTYKIERSDYATHNTLYEGEFLQNFEDNTIENGKQYVYTVTPIYKDRIGKAISLPSVYIGMGKSPSLEDNMMTDKNWWEY